MQVTLESGDISAFVADAIIVNLFEGVTTPGGGTGAVDAALGGMISSLIASGDIRGKSGELTMLHSQGKIASPRVIVAGLGKPGAFNIDSIRNLSADVARYLRHHRIAKAATITHGSGIGGLAPEACAQAMTEGTLLGLYRFMRHKKADDEAEVESLTLVEHDASKLFGLEKGIETGKILAEATNFCRDMANEPANYLTPTAMADQAAAMAKETGLVSETYGPEWMRSKRMGGLLGVAAGSVQEPRFIVLRYNGGGSAAPIALVGKGITFDTGGISIKPAENMGEMKGDMAGGASVIAALGAIARLKPRINVIGIVPATENMPSGNATRPGDVLETMLGKTIEVVNTDAEGRLVLADAIAYAREQGASSVVDVATLTGAIYVALGNVAMGVMGNNESLIHQIKAASAVTGEKVWELPMYDEYFDLIKSDVADMKNSGGRPAGSITAAMLLREFAEDTPWAHLDIAGVDIYNVEKGATVKGASGVPVRTLVQLVMQQAEGGAVGAK